MTGDEGGLEDMRIGSGALVDDDFDEDADLVTLGLPCELAIVHGLVLASALGPPGGFLLERDG